MLEISGVWIGDFRILDEAIEVYVVGYYVVEGFLMSDDVGFKVGFSDVGHVCC